MHPGVGGIEESVWHCVLMLFVDQIVVVCTINQLLEVSVFGFQKTEGLGVKLLVIVQ